MPCEDTEPLDLCGSYRCQLSGLDKEIDAMNKDLARLPSFKMPAGDGGLAQANAEE